MPPRMRLYKVLNKVLTPKRLARARLDLSGLRARDRAESKPEFALNPRLDHGALGMQGLDTIAAASL